MSRATTRRAVWVTVDGSDAQLFPGTVRSTHQTWEAAQRAAGKARLAGHRMVGVESAQVVAMMQAGFRYTEAVQALAGKDVVAVEVKVMP